MQDELKKMLQQVKEGSVTIEQAYETLQALPYKDLGFARVDTHRALRQRFPEVIYAPGKTIPHIKEIAQTLAKESPNILISRAGEDVWLALREALPQSEYHADARMIVVNRQPLPQNKGLILVVSAGTSDIPVAEEAYLTAEIMGNKVECLYDVGVAGIHRLLSQVDLIRSANVLIVVAGMEGALPSVVGGLVQRPVIAVPTSVGYGASFNGLSALLGMLNSCAAGVGVVNIDNGFGAGRLAALINEDRVNE
ncbi:MAG: nickel pincer cofactor biosynthesis protein LarB [Clostridia bacterium]|jgi:NCAIR mutase (PurE)-related protein|nr:nickel pincer cofactor biosynthesis protein LarB [Clostridia bacterium]